MAETKIYSSADLAKHNTKDSLFLAIHGKVYDCSGFIDEHPGGEEVLLDEAGRDASESFEDVGHSDEARDIMSKLYVGEYKTDGTEKTKPKTYASTPKPIPAAEPSGDSGSLQYALALAVVAGCVIWKVLL
ncbi:cytochrome b5 [Gamsiella multidivaricata]|uniref:cytochrome b5 n=1 Tax=Gamsiella multidivaricata TaxID=101098 RepID=UPI00221F7DF6|nr:cytochrome b5 [Gamsiella multidivaricata]KAI7831614.1 cytochrome b5 [Gamsiella multidivaricata]